MTTWQIYKLLDYIDTAISMHATSSPANQSSYQQKMLDIKEELIESAEQA